MRGEAFIPMDYDQTISLLETQLKTLGAFTSEPPVPTREMAVPDINVPLDKASIKGGDLIKS